MLLAGLMLAVPRSGCAQQPSERDSAAVFAQAAERIVLRDVLDSTRKARDTTRIGRTIVAPKAAWAARAVARLRTLERPGDEMEVVSLSVPRFEGDTAVVHEHRIVCTAGGGMYGRDYKHWFARTEEGWRYLYAEGATFADGVCGRVPTNRGSKAP